MMLHSQRQIPRQPPDLNEAFQNSLESPCG